MSHAEELDGARLRRALAELPRELGPRHDLWPGIAGRLDRRPVAAKGGAWWRLAAAVVVTAGGLLAAATLGPVRPPAGPSETAAVPGAAGELAVPRLRQLDGVLHAHRDLVAVIARRGGQLDASGAAALARGLVDLETATAEIAAALEASPGDRRLRLALAAAYRREAAWAARLARA